jgi:hypothetical protein
MITGYRWEDLHCDRSEQSLLKGEGPGQTNTKCCRKMQSLNFSIAVYFFHLPVFSYKNEKLCKKICSVIGISQK